jgi:8-oxo-dGTP diphosphatase
VENKRDHKLDNFFSYSFSLDCLIFGFQDGKINLLLVKRESQPFKDQWAIPGDLIYPDEDLPNAASRILKDLTSIEGIELHQAQTFGNPARHPQGRVITSAYFALVRMDDLEEYARSWSERIQWMPIYSIPRLSFDHNEIAISTFEMLKQKLTIFPIAFDLLPEKFTINNLQEIYEYAFQQDWDKANFRKKLKKIPLIKLNEKQKNVKHRPASLFKLDSEQLSKMIKREDYSFSLKIN